AQSAKSLISILKDHDTSVREAAELALIELGEAAIEPLVCTLVSKNVSERYSAMYFLSENHPQWEKSKGAARAIPVLLAALRDADASVRQQAAEALGQIGDTQAIEPL